MNHIRFIDRAHKLTFSVELCIIYWDNIILCDKIFRMERTDERRISKKTFSMRLFRLVSCIINIRVHE